MSKSLREASLSYVEALKKSWNEIDYILSTAKSVERNVLNGIVRERVYRCFRSLYPLRRDGSFSIGRASVSKWILFRRDDYMVRGVPVDSSTILEFAKEYGEAFKPYVRSSIRDVFGQLVDLTFQIAGDYDVRVVRKTDPLKIHLVQLRYDAGVQDRMVSGFAVDNNYPHYVKLYYDDISDLSSPDLVVEVNDVRTLIILSETIDVLVDLYRELEEKVMDAFEKDIEVIERMEEIVSPWMIAREFST
ncbi:MAG: hypothetical protein QXV85_09945 [Candidatus Bathyarchaeia archaeon]